MCVYQGRGTRWRRRDGLRENGGLFRESGLRVYVFRPPQDVGRVGDGIEEVQDELVHLQQRNHRGSLNHVSCTLFVSCTLTDSLP
jgi:hypothetical protein